MVGGMVGRGEVRDYNVRGAAMILKSAGKAATAMHAAVASLWTFPAILLSAFVIAWAAEAAQFLISQGLALAVLAWLQTLPEFAVEAVIAWQAGRDPSRMHLAIANFTGSLRLLVGLGWPMIYFVALISSRRRGEARFELRLQREHSVEVMALAPPLLYFLAICWKATLTIWDAIPLVACYVAYLWILWRIPPQAEEGEALEDLGYVPRKVLELPLKKRYVAIALLFFAAHPFLESMLAMATAMHVPTFVFVQWVAPFLSEFPEKLSAFYWARKVSTAPLALMNMVSSNINQWTILSAMIPIVFVLSSRSVSPLLLDLHQRQEVLLTILQSGVGLLLLLDMRLRFHEALLLFILWVVQFFVPHWRSGIIYVYLAWCAIQVGLLAFRRTAPPAWIAFRSVIGERLRTTAE
jgi:cation:H+ antiporter